MQTKTKEAAKMIKKVLKKKFPSIRFKVYPEKFVGGDAVHIRWVDGVKEDGVWQEVRIFQYGNFVWRMYIENNRRDDIPQARYVQLHRRISKDKALEILRNEGINVKKRELNKIRDDILLKWNVCTPYLLAYKLERSHSLVSTIQTI